ncbi:hypothetical protein LP420_23365 [Massilia sp. B-10]|nr:hypothetical protein LP420_23365 [Massilia sp. B-10]
MEKLIAERDANVRRDYYVFRSMPRLLVSARQMLRLANETLKPNVERKARLPGTRSGSASRRASKRSTAPTTKRSTRRWH